MQTKLSNLLDDMRSADLTIVATNSPRTIIRADHLKPGDRDDDCSPKNVPEGIVAERDDIVALDGSLIRLPSPVELSIARATCRT